MPYLRKSNGEYCFYLLGKAGEPIQGADINHLELRSIIADTKNFYDELTTDNEGKLKLGSLKEIVYIQISGTKNGKSFNCSWILPYQKEKYFYPYNMDYLEGEEISLPYPQEDFGTGCVSLLKYDQDSSVLENKFSSLVHQKQQGLPFGDLLIKDLEHGTYKLFFKQMEKTINIIVHKGVYWESEKYILSQNQLLEIGDRKALKRITQFELKPNSQNENLSKISFKVDNGQKELKVHCFAYNILAEDSYQMLNRFMTISTQQDRSLTTVKNSKNKYYSNKRFNEELRYALERKYLKSFIGTTLERPTLLYKNKFFQDTYFEVPTQETGCGYQKVQNNVHNVASYNPASKYSHSKR